MKKWKLFFVFGLILLLAASGCSGKTPVTPQKPNAGSTHTTKPETPTAEESEKYMQMDEATAVEMTASAIKTYWHVMTGGKPAEDGAPVQTFLVDGMEYRYLGSDLDTMEKLRAYLGQYFTGKAVDAFIEHARIIVQEGRTAQPNADGGSILQWDKATAELAKESENMKQYEMKVPVGEGKEVQFQPVMVEMKREKGKAWLINTPPHELK
ncbi:hypothetical protein EDM56_00755 [Brevibacillus fluminis]|uniref:Lipoprotein n=1 Tax=Brevibacillus fluminis TaxID=511487 RepID=A0A3M8DWE6_9BACL|nr:DL-endopeptidase inhibitor IseA family protein [Brevibacillus fluminis]RNB92264.1 hypothetical protein EDM56_00755 [Brevibacillus fluminis]